MTWRSDGHCCPADPGRHYHRAMTGSFKPRLLHDVTVRPTEPQAVVEAFLAAIAGPDFSGAAALLDEHVTYVNVGLPPIHGRRRTIGVLKPLGRPGASFEVYIHSIAANGPVVLTERTDVLVFGRLRFQFWVTGRFDVHDGQITLWRDSFDYVDLLRSVGRGLAGALVPGLRPPAPTSAAAIPGRH
ncbi:MAG: limonene,2-epoxide hydrolase [Pseudonocardiales bacterium]|nr:limonene,2-epoxide hydrolase [Pseudonocardiales bacterium]